MPMKKILVLLFVASLLLAGCTELTDAVDENGDEVLKIDVDEDIALEKVEDFLTVDESESFGIMVMYEVDMSEMGDDSGMLNVDENSMMLVEMTEAWSPEGYHSSSVMGIDNGDVTISLLTSVTHVGTTMYVSIGYEIEGELGADATEEETEEFEMMVAMMPEVEHFSMTTTTTHTEVIAAMAEESEDDIDDMDPMAFLEMIEMIEEYGTFTPAESVEGLQLFDVAIDMAEIITPVEALDMCDADDSDGISWSEFVSENCDETDSEDMSDLETLFNDADTDTSGELTVDELQAFIDSVTTFYEDDVEEGDMEDDMGMPSIQVAFTSTGDIEYFSMEMDEMGDEPTVMMMYILTKERVDAMFTGLDAGETVALPFSVSDSMDDDDWGDDSDGEEYFMCDDGEMIPMDYVNDGYDDCDGGEDEWDDNSGGSGHYIDAFLTDNWAMGEEIYTAPEFYVYSGFDQIDEVSFSLADSDGTIIDTWTAYPSDFTPSDGGGMVYFVNLDGASVDEECYTLYATWTTTDMSSGMTQRDDICFDHTESTDDSYIDEMVEQWMLLMDTDGDGNITWDEHDAFISSDEGWESDDVRNDSMMTWSDYDIDANGGLDVDELFELLVMLSESEYDDDGDGGEDSPSPQELLDMTDTDSNGAMTMDEFNAYMNYGETMPQEMIDEFNAIFDEADTDDSGDLDINELEQFITAIDNYMMSMEDSEETFTCDDGETIPLDYVDDGEEDCSDGSDESNMDDDHGDGHDHSDDSDEIVMYITSEMDFHFEGDMSDYKIELATCEEDYDMDTGEETTTCTTVMSVAIADAGEDSDIMFHDADSSGTLSVGDMIHIGETAEDWDTVRLYSVSADAYSDENPMHDAPGFTGLVGMLALLGAAFIRRNE